MQRQLFHTVKASIFTIWLFSVSYTSVQAAPGSIGSLPLFVATPTQPNIFFMLDDSGSMHWSMPSDGVSSTALIEIAFYDTNPSTDKNWFTWCPGANLMAYDPNTDYKPWAGTNPITGNPYPDQTDLSNIWIDPVTAGSGAIFADTLVYGSDSGTKDISAAPVVTWTDSNNDGQYDAGECPNSYGANAVRADSLSAAQQINFANWFSYYRIREHATKGAVSLVISTSSARMGMATLHNNNNVGKPITDMTVAADKNALLTDVANINSSGDTPLRTRLDWVGQYFEEGGTAPSGLNIGSVSSPILPAVDGGECQQNFVMLMTDGQWNGSSPSVGSWDNSVDSNWVYPAHQDNASDTLADIALKWYKTDLAPLANEVIPQTGSNADNLDETKQQHLVTFGVAFGPSGTIDNNPADRTKSFTWPTPVSNQDTTVDDLRHAAYNGRGKFLSASNPPTLIKALQDVISDIESRQGSAAAAAFSSTSLVAGTSLFFASFNSIGWKGDVEAYPIDVKTGDLAASSTWSAASKLDGRLDADMPSRVIYTWGTDSNGDNNGVLFNWSTSNPQPDSDILDDFKKNQDTTTEAASFPVSQKRMSFVRGDKSYDDTNIDSTGLIRSRASRLGDIIHSAPRYVGSPISGWPDKDPFGVAGSRYSSYQSSLETTPRDAVVYVGANDGMLHGFNSVDGQEVFAYLPGATVSTDQDSGLHYLTESDYQHRYYVDGPAVSADVFIRTNLPTDPIVNRSWRTVLVGSLRGGGQGLYALDVTDPSQYSNTETAANNTVLWEFTDQDDADLGLTYSDPEITMMNNDQWAVIIGNGYNATGTDTAKLMILFIEKGIDGQWSAGDYIKIDTGVGTSGNKNGLSTPTLIDLDDDGTTDRIYAGDVHGNMWAFDVSDSNTSKWESAYEDKTDPANPFPIPLFAAGNSKPITMKPLVHKPEQDWIADNTATNAPNVMVNFGTGQYIAAGDASNTDQQTFYNIWDAGVQVSSGKLVEQTFLPGFPANSRVLSENNVDYNATPSVGNLGWFINLPEAGERVTVNAFELEDIIFFNTLTPSVSPCSAGGSSWQMAVDKITGGNPEIIALDSNGDGKLDED